VVIWSVSGITALHLNQADYEHRRHASNNRAFAAQQSVPPGPQDRDQ
jgi:hypothetical protein